MMCVIGNIPNKAVNSQNASIATLQLRWNAARLTTHCLPPLETNSAPTWGGHFSVKNGCTTSRPPNWMQIGYFTLYVGSHQEETL